MVITRLRALMRQPLARHVGAYGAAELAARVTRLGTTVIVARQTGAQALGDAALVLTLFELFRVLTNAGFSQALIRTGDEHLDSICRTVGRCAWGVCIAAACLQAAAGLLVARTMSPQAGLMLALLSLVYLVMAPGLVPVYLIQRDRRLGILAGVSTAQMLADNILTAAFALAGLGAWALVLPKIAVAPIWLFGVRAHQKRRPAWSGPMAPIRPMLRYALPILGTEIVTAARLNLDNVLVGAILGTRALGTYYFVFNAGIGLSLSLTSALGNTLYPHLARGTWADITARFDRTVMTAVLPVCAVIALQALSSQYYVPWIFGARWSAAAPLVAMLCACAATRPLSDAASQLLRATGRTGQDFATNLVCTALYLGCFAAALPGGLGHAIRILAVSATGLQLASLVSARLTAGSTQGRLQEIPT